MICAPINSKVESVEDGNIPCNKYLYKLIIEEGIFLSGHYSINQKISARDWINLEKLFSLKRKKFIEPISSFIYEEILCKQQYNADESALIGLNYYGAILASVIGYKYDLPFSYYFDDKKKVDDIENELQAIENKHLVIITDVMVWGKAVCKLVDKLCNDDTIQKNKKVDVIVLFERKINSTCNSRAYLCAEINNIYILNDDFDLEICKKEPQKCIFRQDEKMCQYKNKCVGGENESNNT